MSGRLLRIVPGPKLGNGAHLTHGTQVLLPSGEKVSGVTGIVIRGSVKDDVWRAEISCLVEALEITCLESTEREFRPSLWQRFKAWANQPTEYRGPG